MHVSAVKTVSGSIVAQTIVYENSHGIVSLKAFTENIISVKLPKIKKKEPQKFAFGTTMYEILYRQKRQKVVKRVVGLFAAIQDCNSFKYLLQIQQHLMVLLLLVVVDKGSE